MFIKNMYRFIFYAIVPFLLVFVFTGCGLFNKAPYTPNEPTGHTRGRAGVTYAFKTVAVDPNGDNVSLQFDWGDGQQSAWSEFVPSGDTVTMSHVYNDSATFQIRVMAKDKGGKKSDWSAAHKIIIGDKPFFDSFSYYNVGDTIPFGEWQVFRNGYTPHIEQTVQIDTTTGNVLKTDNPMDKNGVAFVDGDWLSFSFQVDTKDGEPGVYFRLSYNGSKKGYFVTRPEGSLTGLVLYKFTGSTEQKIAEGPNFNINGWWRLRVEAVDSSIKIFANGTKYIDVIDNDSSLLSGGIGVGSRYGSVYFDNVDVETIK